MSASAVMILLRLIHILSGVFWAGAVMIVAWFILPAQRRLGEPGLAFLQELMLHRRLRVFMMGAMILTILSGLTMYTRMAMLTHGAWTSTTNGIVLGIGGVAAIIGGGIGGGVVSSAAKKLMTLGGQVQAAGVPPTDTQQAEMARLQGRISGAFRITAVLVVIAVAAMASARYL
jgi:uncharacterized membrane protein